MSSSHTVSRRRVIGGLVAAPVILGSAARAAARADFDVAIVGAGAAGLAAAHALREKGLKARIFEARSRIGGRVFTDESLGVPFEAGARYIHFSERNPWREIAENLGVPLLDDDRLSGGFRVFRAGRPVLPEERTRRRGAFGRLSAMLDEADSPADLSFTEAAERAGSELLEPAAAMTLLALGEDPGRVSVRDYQRLDSGTDHVVPGGYGHLLERYGDGLDIRLDSPVRAIDLSRDAVRLTLADGIVAARAVIVTVSAGLLAAEAIRIRPGLPATMRAALDGIGMGAMAKIAFRATGDRFGLSPWTQFFDQGNGGDLVSVEFWSFDRDVIVAVFGGDYARALASAGEREAVETMRARLLAMLGSDAAKGLGPGRLAGWSADPFALGSYSIAKPGQAGARAALEPPVSGRLWLAGEANAGKASMTAGGAAIAGRRAAVEIARALAPARARRD